MKKEEYGEQFNEHLLEQYKLYVEMADRISDRRERTNMFYISLLSVFLTLIFIVMGMNVLNEFQIVVLFIIISILGFALCIIWYIHIRSYRQLNSGKFKVIHEMEQYLPFSFYIKECDILIKKKESNGYILLTKVEQYVPLIFAILFAFNIFITYSSFL
ncbi:MAG: hypothetical protein HF967_04855 [Methanosarcinales archaeon]|nr:hypothetical protein [Methanosarcinales archaeon]